jgi:uncharacterized protein (DUF58 family)
MNLQIKDPEGSKIGNTIGVSNKLVEMNDVLPEHTALSGESNYKLFGLTGSRIKSLHYKIYCPLRRYYTIGPANVRVMDNFRLFQKEYVVKKYHHFPVFLSYHTLKNFKLRSKAFDWNFGQNLLNILGKSDEFYTLRDYTKQDSYREINWKSTARKRKLMVNKFERETLSDCCILIDSRLVTGYGRPDDNFIEYSVRLAFGLAKSVINNNNRISIVTYGENIKLLPPGLGRNHTEYIHALLLNTEPKGYYTFYSALVYIWPYLKPKSTVVIFSPMDFDESLLSSLVHLQRMDMKIVMVTSSPLTFESRALETFTDRNRLDKERRRLRIKELRKWGVDVITWEPTDSFDLILKKINIASGIKGSNI